MGSLIASYASFMVCLSVTRNVSGLKQSYLNFVFEHFPHLAQFQQCSIRK